MEEKTYGLGILGNSSMLTFGGLSGRVIVLYTGGSGGRQRMQVTYGNCIVGVGLTPGAFGAVALWLLGGGFTW